MPAGAAAIFKHHRDNRYAANEVVAHGRDRVAALAVGRATDILPKVTQGHRLVAIDEGHFFDDALVESCVVLARRGLQVVVTALDLNSWGMPFGVVERLRQAADECVLKTANCARCGQPATRTQRLTPIIAGQIIGGPESFEPRCLACWSPPPEKSVD